MAEWLYENGIGEERAILVDKGRIVAARIERHHGIKPGTIVRAQLITKIIAGSRGIVRLADGSEALLSPLPKDIDEGASLLVEVVRAAIDEKGRFKLPQVREALPDSEPGNGPNLYEQIGTSEHAARICHAHEPDHFEEAGWGELLEEARTGDVRFPGGALQVAITSAMTLIDVDGDLPPTALALAAAAAATGTIRRLDLQGNIGIDFPNLPAKAERQQVAEIFDAAMTGPFERTAINGFGLMQVVTRRVRPSLPELIQHRRVTFHALQLLRIAERCPVAGPITLVCEPSVVAVIKTNDAWLAQLAKRTGRAVALRGDADIAIGGGYVEPS